MAYNSIGDAEYAVEFSNVAGLCMEIDKGVITVGQTVDFVSELALTPVINIINDTVTFCEGGLEILRR